MKAILLPLAVSLVMITTAVSQEPAAPPEQVKPITAPQPVFPEEAKDYTFGESVVVSMNVDKKGLVRDARAYGPLAPCSNLKHPLAEAINKAALAAAKATVFEPILKNGKPVEARLSVTYRLRPKPVKSEPEEGRKMIQGGVLNGKALSLPRPTYPPMALANRSPGVVSIGVLIDEEGRIISAGPVGGHPDFADAAIESACGARFSPTKLSGQPVKVSGVITYSFVP